MTTELLEAAEQILILAKMYNLNTVMLHHYFIKHNNMEPVETMRTALSRLQKAVESAQQNSLET